MNSFNEKNRCCVPTCAKPLRRYKGRSEFWNYSAETPVFGWRGNMLFCSKSCAAYFGIRKCSTMIDDDADEVGLRIERAAKSVSTPSGTGE
jgi:hypothetical protein